MELCFIMQRYARACHYLALGIKVDKAYPTFPTLIYNTLHPFSFFPPKLFIFSLSKKKTLFFSTFSFSFLQWRKPQRSEFETTTRLSRPSVRFPELTRPSLSSTRSYTPTCSFKMTFLTCLMTPTMCPTVTPCRVSTRSSKASRMKSRLRLWTRVA